MQENAYKINKYSTDAIIACVLGGVSIVMLVAAVIISYCYDGKGPKFVGLLGMGALILEFIGFLFSRASWNTQDGGLLMKRIGLLINVLPLVASVILFIVGIFS